MIRGFGARGTMTPLVRQNLETLLIEKIADAAEAEQLNHFALADCHRASAAALRKQLEQAGER